MKKIKELFTKPVIIGLASVAVVAGGGTAAGVHMHNESVRQEQAAKQKAKKAAAEKAEATRKKYNELLKTVDFQLQNSIFTGAESASKETLQGNLTELTKRLQEKDVYEGDYKLCDKLAKDVQTIYDQSKTIAEGKDAEAKNVDPAGYGEFYTADMKTQVEGFRTAYDTAYKAGKYLDASTAIDNMMNVFRTASRSSQLPRARSQRTASRVLRRRVLRRRQRAHHLHRALLIVMRLIIVRQLERRAVRIAIDSLRRWWHRCQV